MKISDLKVKVIVPEKDLVPIKNFQNLIAEINTKELSPEVVHEIEQKIATLNTWEGSARSYLKEVDKTKHKILKILHKELGIVHRNYYSGLWLSLGMACFGLPLGTIIFVVSDNAALMGVGLPIGMMLGIGIGAYLDRRAEEQNKVLISVNQ